MTAKERQQKSYERQKLRGFKEGKIWLSPASQAALEAEVSRRTLRGERAVSRQVVLAELVEAALTAPDQADLVELRHELRHARAEIARLEEKVRYGRG